MKRALAALLLFAMPLAAQEQTFGEVLDVVRYLVPARVVDPGGRAIRGLTPADFTATIAGKKAIVEAVEWIGASDPDVDYTDPNAPPAPPRGRLILIFVQTDFARSPARVKGQMHFNATIDRLLEVLEPSDQVAVVSHDSHLKLQCDFTSDRAVVAEAVRKALDIRKQTLPPAPESGPSIVRQLDAKEMRDAASVGKAMGMAARALRANEGEKIVIVAGWGMGEMVNGMVVLDDAWRDAMAQFRAAHIPVITLGTGLGGQLSAGLMATAQETGGFYTATQNFPEQSLNRLRGMLAGQYEVVLRVDGELPPGEYRVDIKTTRSNATVLSSSLTVVRVTQAATETMIVEKQVAESLDASKVYLEAMHKLRDGDGEAAEALLTKAIAMARPPAESWYERAMLLAARGEMEQATADLRAYLEKAPGGKHANEAQEMLAAWQ